MKKLPGQHRLAQVDLSFLTTSRLDGSDADGFFPSPQLSWDTAQGREATPEEDRLRLLASHALAARVRAWQSTGARIEANWASALEDPRFLHMELVCEDCDLYAEWQVSPRTEGGYPEGPLLAGFRVIGFPKTRERTGGRFLCPHWDVFFEPDPAAVRAVYELELLTGR